MGKFISKILKAIGITGFTDWLMKMAVKIFKTKILSALLRKLNDDVMPKLKRQAFKIGVEFSALLLKLADRGHLGAGTAQAAEGYLFELLDSFKSGATSD